MLNRYVALVSETDKVKLPELSAVAAAVQKQVTRDFGPIWGVQANVAAFARLEDVPLDYWPVIIKDTLQRPGAAGYHEDSAGEPNALVLMTDDWSITASHETLELLADPWGRHLVAGESPSHSGNRVKFLVEVCDPCSNSSYTVNGIAVSDFYTPHFFDPVATSGVRYSYAGSLSKPRHVLKGGYLTWYDPALREWWHRAWFGGRSHKDEAIPIPSLVQGNIRSAVDRHLRDKHGIVKRTGGGASPKKPAAAFVNRAGDLRKAINART